MVDINEKFQKEKDCYKYCREQESACLNKGNIEAAIAYAENATRSLREIIKLEKYIEELQQIKILVVEIENNRPELLRSRI